MPLVDSPRHGGEPLSGPPPHAQQRRGDTRRTLTFCCILLLLTDDMAARRRRGGTAPRPAPVAQPARRRRAVPVLKRAIWSVHRRLVGLCYLFTFASLYWQVAGLVGPDGIFPAATVVGSPGHCRRRPCGGRSGPVGLPASPRDRSRVRASVPARRGRGRLRGRRHPVPGAPRRGRPSCRSAPSRASSQLSLGLAPPRAGLLAVPLSRRRRSAQAAPVRFIPASSPSTLF